jgi:hypothetical protein
VQIGEPQRKNDEKTYSALELASRQLADRETRKISSIKNERKSDFALWLWGEKSSVSEIS